MRNRASATGNCPRANCGGLESPLAALGVVRGIIELECTHLPSVEIVPSNGVPVGAYRLMNQKRWAIAGEMIFIYGLMIKEAIHTSSLPLSQNTIGNAHEMIQTIIEVGVFSGRPQFK